MARSVKARPPDMCSAFLSVLGHILKTLKVQVGGRSTAAWGQRMEPGCDQSFLHKAVGLTHTYTHTHAAHTTQPSGLLGNQSHLRLGQIHDARRQTLQFFSL